MNEDDRNFMNMFPSENEVLGSIKTPPILNQNVSEAVTVGAGLIDDP